MDVKVAVGPNIGAPFTDKVGEKELTVSLLTQETQARLEDLLIARRRALLQKDKKFMTDPEYAAVYNDFHDRIVAGHYAFGGKLMDEWLKSFPGMAAMLEATTGVPEKEWGVILQGPHQDDLGRIIARIWADSFPN